MVKQPLQSSYIVSNVASYYNPNNDLFPHPNQKHNINITVSVFDYRDMLATISRQDFQDILSNKKFYVFFNFMQITIQNLVKLFQYVQLYFLW